MTVPNVDVNYLAVFVSAIVSMILGSLWYSPLLFGNAWMKLSGAKKDMNKAKAKGMIGSYLAMFIGVLLTAFILAHFVQYVTASSFFEGMQAGVWLWLGFIAPVLLGSMLWEGKPFRYYLINVIYHLINLAVMGGILAVWQ